MRAGVLLWGLSPLARLFLCSFLWHLHLFGFRCPFGIGHRSDWVRAALTASFKSITPAKAPLPNTVTFQGGKCAKRKLWSTHSPTPQPPWPLLWQPGPASTGPRRHLSLTFTSAAGGQPRHVFGEPGLLPTAPPQRGPHHFRPPPQSLSLVFHPKIQIHVS